MLNEYRPWALSEHGRHERLDFLAMLGSDGAKWLQRILVGTSYMDELNGSLAQPCRFVGGDMISIVYHLFLVNEDIHLG